MQNIIVLKPFSIDIPIEALLYKYHFVEAL